jgi:ribosomal protein S18 acetylase RimI-like enzyme
VHVVQVSRTAAPTIRVATPGDAAALAELAERTFRDTFGPSNTAENMRLHCERSYAAAIQAAEIADPARTTLVADAGGRLVGYGQLRWNATHCLVAARPAEIQRIYVDRPWHGGGIAQALMSRLLDSARAGGADRVWLGVWEHNLRARAFYRKAGFTEVGDHSFVLGDETQRDLVMARAP